MTRGGAAWRGEGVAVPERGVEIAIEGAEHAVAQSVNALEAWARSAGPVHADAQPLELRHVDPSLVPHRGLHHAVVAPGGEAGAALPDDRRVSPVQGHRVSAEGVGHLVAIAEHGAVAGCPTPERVERGAETLAAEHGFHAGKGGVGHSGGRWPAPGAEAEQDSSNHDYRRQRAKQDRPWANQAQTHPTS